MAILNQEVYDNTKGQMVRFNIIPFIRGEGKIIGCYRREVVHYTFHHRYGDISHVYDLFDIEIAVADGYEFGTLNCAAPVAKEFVNLTGSSVTLHGLTRLQLMNAITNGDVLSKASCA
ncbi:MAG: hypothetical protein C0456_18975 [Hyphomonas sp.]|uniref:hypothetical protein n=1 Tax=Hyphomonas sp. TaxID=87 RepID=UPI001DCAFB80|nr:hypothetical protein [Hyphomonas sp.]MBA4228692.1 hypothetical protein [Hyphomonas sp.]